MRKQKRNYIILTLSIIIIFIVGLYFYKTNTGTLVCTYTSNQDGIIMTSEHKAEFKNRKVLKVKTVEKITLDDQDELNLYKKTLKNMYEAYTTIEYYENNISTKDNTLNSVTTINYEKIDIKKLIKIDGSFKKLLDKNNNVKVTKLRKKYESLGAICKYKN